MTKDHPASNRIQYLPISGSNTIIINVKDNRSLDDERYKWLNDVVCVGIGLVRKKTQNWSEENPSDLVLDVGELVWEPLMPES
ncbi:MAG: DUF3237 domain-containing protein [Thaumarchaeota archaeon]|nr:DUF3237 domain-containing protein [Nitrososphaerota archaeon]